MSTTIRPITPNDEPIWRKLWAEYLAFYETSRDEAVYIETWRRIHDPDEDMFALVAETPEHGVIGLAHFLHHRFFWGPENRIYLNDLYVQPDLRGTGAGKALIEAVVDHAKANDCSQVWWLTAEDNAQARKLYDGVATLIPFVKYQI